MPSKRKKIIYIVTKTVVGGAQKYVFDLATSLSPDNFDVLVASGKIGALNKRLENFGIRTQKINRMERDIKIFSELLVLSGLLKLFLKEKPDIIHLNSSKASGLGAFAARVYQLFALNRNLKIIFTVHGWAFNEARFNNKIIRFLSWLSAFLSTKTIVISKQNLEEAVKWPFVKNKFCLIYNGIKKIDFKDRESSRKFLSKITGVSAEKPWLVTIAELHKNKGLEYLIGAVARLEKKPAVFVIGEGEERNNLEELIKKLFLEKDVFLMGSVENASSLLKAFDIFILTSIKEGLPYTILEAGLSELPVIASKIPGIVDIINEKNGVLTEAKDPEKIAGEIQDLLKNRKKMAQLGAHLRETVRKKFPFQKMEEKTLSLYL
ncbi:hypothetical protein COV42_00085 [Candidatus Campbellbacteria bacterium CG11_big_fil_rev_8_21_14_0_20_44_21]|uniref:Glycosyltransferase family 1 protein n=1 Tax=Candidatus Campbellbacteria bacterium CG22_combo_CG10-13_8_21_14_all_43_18 TaxID=1974530 RepID=A0A2H0DVT3_9BACT|nr:MAG: hypothetical protein COW82_02825 [Candidatus Campbellbacteria bacterium CG22_combo_CG10-13_8_21_14_all_43_18]PIR24567.1 MAG: hypothetical protein COV42_00085 [Candidatus Campbellbacteria bacterium CG11_big_fil_rev_8_21_14_0_20_44_21]